MSNTNLNPVVLIHGISGSRLITKNRLGFPEELWVNLYMMKQGSDSESKSGNETDETIVQSSPEVVGDAPESELDRSAAKEPDPWWKDNMQLASDGITPKVEKGEIFNRNVKGLKGLAKVFSDTTPDFVYDKETKKWVDLRYYKPLIEALKDKGYSEKESEGKEGNLLGAPYDWRISPKGLSDRYNYFNWLKGQIEQLYNINNQNRVVIIAHSMGNRVTLYFLQWIKNSNPGQEGWGQAWLDKYIERYIAVAPPFLGAPMSVRMVATNDPIKLASLFLSGMKPVLQSFSSIPWLFPVQEAEEAEYFNTSHFAFVKTADSYEPQGIVQTLTKAGGQDTILTYREDYQNDANFSEQKYGSKGIECPPVEKLDVIYAPGTPTEIGAYYTELNGELSLDTTKSEKQDLFVVNKGLRLETSQTTQKIDGTQNSGDGLVPYASLVYFKQWQKDSSVTTQIGDYPIVFEDAGTVAGHERVLKDQKGVDKILSLLGL